ncbi:cytochrome P450 [Frankia sp. AgB1.9]|uniref:cytochrome P450 n=1 Tax=unclassified Frankia TaxID=2632575 RepID=UPI001933AF9C|nr:MULTISPECIES: cytochrome P450 [unclassified Frankia]MBL7487579.1 cytochrome P450 [Frankia sp. AgW1.1]MBL7548957.1 cytochrome P450 [Frankia sp. AgB1.9]MBL7620660.1 cytochrome P450 [Frankia sp. AgB1.8]
MTIVDFDWTPIGVIDPYPLYARMREAGRVLRTERGPWLLPHYAEVRAAHANPEDFSLSAVDHAKIIPGQMMGRSQPGYNDNVLLDDTVIVLDSPDHERVRGVVRRAFTPRAVAAAEAEMRKKARALVAPLAKGDAIFDVVGDLAAQFPGNVIANMVGVPPEEAQYFQRMSDNAAGIGAEAGELTPRERGMQLYALFGYFDEQVAKREKDGPTPDLVGRLVEANQDGRLSHSEVVASCIIMILGGHETTMRLITNAVLSLGRYPEQRERVVRDPTLSAAAVEETLRFDSPVQYFSRGTRQDTVIAGVEIPKGQNLCTMLGSANRDPEVFTDPDTFDIGRDSAVQHMSFGHGVHFCLGASLARLEAKVAIEELLAVAPEYQLVTPTDDLIYPTNFLRSPQHLVIKK